MATKEPPVKTAPVTEDEALADKVIDLLQRNPRVAKAAQEAAARVQARPSGEYRRNYEREAALRVTGGLEVRHAPDFVPDPPSWCKKYVGEGNTKVDKVEMALKDEDGQPMKTDEYKAWLDARMKGKRLDGDVRTDISAGSFVVDDPGVSVALG